MSRRVALLFAMILVVAVATLVSVPPVADEALVIQPSADRETPGVAAPQGAGALVTQSSADRVTPSIAGPQPTAIPSPTPSGVSALVIQSAAASDAIHLAISNVRDTLFTVSWLTAEAETGQVQLADGMMHADARGSDFGGTTHYVTVTGLQANHQYSFDVISSDKRYDRAGAHWTVNTGETLASQTPDLVFGRIRNPDGSNATDVIVFSMIDRVQQGVGSAPLSTLVTARDGGFFSMNLGETRAWSDPTKHFAYAINSDRYMNNSVTFQAVSRRGAGLVTVDAGDEGLRARDSGKWLVIQLTTSVD